MCPRSLHICPADSLRACDTKEYKYVKALEADNSSDLVWVLFRAVQQDSVIWKCSIAALFDTVATNHM